MSRFNLFVKHFFFVFELLTRLPGSQLLLKFWQRILSVRLSCKLPNYLLFHHITNFHVKTSSYKQIESNVIYTRKMKPKILTKLQSQYDTNIQVTWNRQILNLVHFRRRSPSNKLAFKKPSHINKKWSTFAKSEVICKKWSPRGKKWSLALSLSKYFWLLNFFPCSRSRRQCTNIKSISKGSHPLPIPQFFLTLFNIFFANILLFHRAFWQHKIDTKGQKSLKLRVNLSKF